MAEAPSDKPLVDGIREDLHAVRDRGLDRLDVDTKKQPRKPVPYLEWLAFAFCTTLGIPVYGRIAAIDALLRRALSAYAECGNQVHQELLDEVYLDPPGVGPQLPLDRMEQARNRRKSRVSPPEFTAYVGGVIDQFAPFLLDFAIAAIRNTTARQLPAAMLSTREPVQSAAPNEVAARRRRGRWVAAAIVGLVMAGLIVARLLGGTLTSHRHAPASTTAAATTAYGYVTCWPDTTKAIEGVWIDAPSGGSGWADWHTLPSQPNVAYFSRTLPHGGQYFVHVGCGGSSVRWELPVDSVNPVYGEGYRFTCYDTFTTDNPYSGQCRP